jgi:hypothetical protein
LPEGFEKETLEAWWSRLADLDPQQADPAVWSLVATPAESVPFLRERLQFISADAAKRAPQLLGDLGSMEFPVRQQADGELEKLGDAAAPALREFLDGKPPLDAQQRAERLFAAATRPIAESPERLRQLRALTVLELLATPEARRLLEAYGQGAKDTLLTRESKASLARLRQRVPTP